MAGLPANWSTMSDAEKRAWGNAQTAPAASQKPAPQASSSTGDSAVDSLYARDGGYLRKRGDGDTHTDHSRDGR